MFCHMRRCMRMVVHVFYPNVLLNLHISVQSSLIGAISLSYYPPQWLLLLFICKCVLCVI